MRGQNLKDRWQSTAKTVPQSTRPWSSVSSTLAWWWMAPGPSLSSPTTGGASTSWSKGSTATTQTGVPPPPPWVLSAGSLNSRSPWCSNTGFQKVACVPHVPANKAMTMLQSVFCNLCQLLKGCRKPRQTFYLNYVVHMRLYSVSVHWLRVTCHVIVFWKK